MQSPVLTQTKPWSLALSDTAVQLGFRTRDAPPRWAVRERVAEERQKAPTLTPPLEYTNTSASLHACPSAHFSSPFPPLSSLHPSTVHSRAEVGLTFCPGSQALRHRWVPADIHHQRRKAQAGWQRTARRASRGGMRVQPLRQWEETAAAWAPLHNLLS